MKTQFLFCLLTILTALAHSSAIAGPGGERKSGSDFVLPVTFPMLEIKIEHSVDNLKVWEVRDGKKGNLIFDSFAWWLRWRDSKDQDAECHRFWAHPRDSHGRWVAAGA
tara:strand:- start:422 stop:748 length:327 start_codon:yes stop_codon:yes gene_type:complete